MVHDDSGNVRYMDVRHLVRSSVVEVRGKAEINAEDRLLFPLLSTPDTIEASRVGSELQGSSREAKKHRRREVKID